MADLMTRYRMLVGYLNIVDGLVTANAYVSTLGGGHFLCKHVDQAQRLAMLQASIAMKLGDPITASRCRVNIGYSQLLVRPPLIASLALTSVCMSFLRCCKGWELSDC